MAHNLIKGDIFVLGDVNNKESYVDTSIMYVYMCEHPWKEIGVNRIVCSQVQSTSDTKIKVKFLQNTGNYTVIGKHEFLNWVDEAIDILKRTYDSEEIQDFLAKVKDAPSETKKEIAKSLSDEGFRENIAKQKYAQWMKNNVGGNT